jgi:hypothetical protein
MCFGQPLPANITESGDFDNNQLMSLSIELKDNPDADINLNKGCRWAIPSSI